jgi:hypothetical protein
MVVALRLGGGGESEVLTSKRKNGRTDSLRPTFPQEAPRLQPRHGGGGGRRRVVEALPLYLPGQATAAPVIHSRSGSVRSVCPFYLDIYSDNIYFGSSSI